MQDFGFKIEKRIEGSLGRAGIITTLHGEIETPAFVPVGTKATVKSLTPEQIKETGAQIVLTNTYHLYLQPGEQIVREAGGVGKFMNWRRSNGEIAPTMTDSGGFQVFSLGAAYGKELSKVVRITDPSLLIPERADENNLPRLAKIGEDGVSFKSHLDGSLHYITPERSIEIQHNLGADIIFAFDECISPAEDLKYQRESLERTHRWAQRSLDHHEKLSAGGERSNLKGTQGSTLGSQNIPALFGIVQGGRNEDLRRQSAKIISEMKGMRPAPYDSEGIRSGFDGFGIGGSFAKEDMESAVKWVNEILPEDKPRHLLGIGEPEDLFMGVENGVDLFDCVAPTRNARNATLYTSTGKINITNAQFTKNFLPIDEGCNCYTCKNFTRSYLNHLFRGKEMLAGTLATIHNLHFIIHLVRKMRLVILEENFQKFKKNFLSKYVSK